MGLNWVRLDANWYTNHKFMSLAEDKRHAAISVYWAGLAYSGAHDLDGYVPKSAVRVITATLNTDARVVSHLVSVGLWIPEGSGGWQVKDYAEFQPTSEENRQRSLRAKAAAEIRWSKPTKDAARNA